MQGGKRKFKLNKLIDAIKDDEYDDVEDILSGKGVKINKKDKKGRTALHYAVQVSKDIVDLVLEQEPNVDIRDKNGDTPLHLAVSSDLRTKYKLRIIRALIDADVKLDKKNDDGDTPLHIAVSDLEPQIVKELIDEGARKNIKNDDGMTAEDLALKMKQQSSDSGYTRIYRIFDLKPATTLVTYSPSTTIISKIPSNCNLNFGQFLADNFPYNFNDFVRLMSFFNNNIKLMINCKNVTGQTQLLKVYNLRWNEIARYISFVGQNMRFNFDAPVLRTNNCYGETNIDLYLLYQLLNIRELIRSKNIKICPKRVITSTSSFYKVAIEPRYNVDIRNGKPLANSQIKATLNQLISHLKRASTGSRMLHGVQNGRYFIYFG